MQQLSTVSSDPRFSDEQLIAEGILVVNVAASAFVMLALAAGSLATDDSSSDWIWGMLIPIMNVGDALAGYCLPPVSKDRCKMVAGYTYLVTPTLLSIAVPMLMLLQSEKTMKGIFFIAAAKTVFNAAVALTVPYCKPTASAAPSAA